MKPTANEMQQLMCVARAIKEAWPDDMSPIKLSIAKVLAEAAIKAVTNNCHERLVSSPLNSNQWGEVS